MLRHSRVSGTPDISRLGEGLARPGMDTRTWVSLAVVGDVAVDPVNGLICAITLLPSGQKDTARMGVPYAGRQWGAHLPVAKDDEVLVCAPSGDADEGLVIVARLHSPSDPLPQDVVTHPDDPSTTVQPGKSWRLTTSLAGKVLVNSGSDVELTSASGEVRGKAATRFVADSAQVLLGGDTAVQQLIMGTAYRAAQVSFDTALTTFFGAMAVGWTAVATGATAFGSGFTAASHATGLSPTDQAQLNAAATAAGVLSGAATVASTACLVAGVAVVTFEGLAATFLSLISKTK